MIDLIIILLGISILTTIITIIIAIKVFRPLDLKKALDTSFQELKIDEKLGAFKEIGKNIDSVAMDLKNIFMIKQRRAVFTEIELEDLLGDMLPKEKFGIRKELKSIGKPDAHILTKDGIIIVDGKFPLENYNRMIKEKEEDKKGYYKNEFRRDINARIDEVQKYINPKLGTTPFAFAFIPSEAVYYYLISEEFELVKSAQKRGVILVSPVTFRTYLNTIRLGIRATQLSENVKEVLRELETLKINYNNLEKDLGTLLNHISKAYNKAGDVDKGFKEIKNEFERIVNNNRENGKELGGENENRIG